VFIPKLKHGPVGTLENGVQQANIEVAVVIHHRKIQEYMLELKHAIG
jgi:hypothetical protein